MRQTYHDPGGILVSASILTRFATARTRWKFNVVWQRMLDATAHRTIQSVDMVNIAGFMHDDPPWQTGLFPLRHVLIHDFLVCSSLQILLLHQFSLPLSWSAFNDLLCGLLD